MHMAYGMNYGHAMAYGMRSGCSQHALWHVLSGMFAIARQCLEHGVHDCLTIARLCCASQLDLLKSSFQISV